MLKHSLMLALGIFANLISFGQENYQTVKITNLENVKGNLYIGWYNQAATFRVNEKAIYREKVAVGQQNEVSVIFKNIPKGKYAIAVFLDENDNYQLDKNMLGIPKEKYGFSNNRLPALRPATFEESAFELQQQNAMIHITLK